MSNLDPEVVRNLLDFLVLNTVNQEPNSGVEIERRIEQRAHRFFDFRNDSVSQSLRRLENSGRLEAELRLATDSQLELVYSITDIGKQHLEAEWKVRQRTLARFVEEGHWSGFHLRADLWSSWN